ncbi:hypothetical protein ABZP36_022149 [Zizania latifolia]
MALPCQRAERCPVCTAPHFPFCPPPPLSPHPFPYDLHPPPPPPPPEYHAPFHPPPPPPPPPMWGPPGPHPYELLDREGPHKRMRVAEAPPFDPAKISVISACDLFKQPLRASRPDHIVIILRGLPGSGKSYLAKALRNLEVENGGNAPRIHSMDDYFMIEVEKKVEDSEGSKSSGTSKGRKQLTKKVIEYCYEPEMEETYRSSMLNTFKKTLDEGNFTFVIVDDVKKMAVEWEEAPPLYLRLDIHSLFHDDNLHEHSIQEVDMDTEDVDDANSIATSTKAENTQKAVTESLDNGHNQDVSKAGENWDSSEEDDLDGYKELGQSKWSKDFDEDTKKSDHVEGSRHALSGLAQTYGTHRKTVSWGDQLEKGGFSIGAAKRRLTFSLIIGPGSGYNLASNPLAEGNSMGTKGESNNETKKRFSEQLRDEGESFRATTTPESEWKNWAWHSEGDLFMNCAVFQASSGAIDRKLKKSDMVKPKPGSYVRRPSERIGKLSCQGDQQKIEGKT